MTRIGLVGCAAGKRKSPHPARDLYTSPLFRKAAAHAEDVCDRWYVLSALHGLVAPDTVLAPYDVRLGVNHWSTPPIHQWARGVATQLHEALADVEDPTLYVLAGEQYRTVLRHLDDRYPAEVPMQGLGIGQQLAWLTERAPAALPRR